MNNNNFAAHLTKLQSVLRAGITPAMFISNIQDVHYLSGFTGDTGYMLITPESAVFFTDARFSVQVQSDDRFNALECRIVNDYKNDVFAYVASKCTKLLLQAECPVGIASIMKANGAEIFVDEKDTLKTLRMIKEYAEVSAIKAQYDIAGQAFLDSLEKFRVGKTENDWAFALEHNMRKHGAKSTSFETIVASGVRGAMPHGAASKKTVEQNDPVVIDFGSRYEYNSDYTRMIYGGNDDHVLKVIDIVRSALLKSIEAVKPGKLCMDIDRLARNYIAECGYGDYFNHGLGHGVGLDVHELPAINKRSESVITENMIFTIEPGIYIPGEFGVRLEDTVLVNAEGAEVISSYLGKYVYLPA